MENWKSLRNIIVLGNKEKTAFISIYLKAKKFQVKECENIEQTRCVKNVTLLVVYISEKSDIVTAKDIGKYYSYLDIPLIVISSTEIFAMQAVNELHCLFYILESNFAELITPIVTQIANNNFQDGDEYFTCNSKGTTYSIRLVDIVYIKKSSKNIIVKTTNNEIEIYNFTIKRISNYMHCTFLVQCHRAHVININYLQSFTRTDREYYIELISGEKIPVGITYIDAINAIFKARISIP